MRARGPRGLIRPDSPAKVIADEISNLRTALTYEHIFTDGDEYQMPQGQIFIHIGDSVGINIFLPDASTGKHSNGQIVGYISDDSVDGVLMSIGAPTGHTVNGGSYVEIDNQSIIQINRSIAIVYKGFGTNDWHVRLL